MYKGILQNLQLFFQIRKKNNILVDHYSYEMLETS